MKLKEKWPVIKIILIYLLTAGIWVLVTDQVLLIFAKDIKEFYIMGVLKALLFIFVTAWLLYILIARLVNKVKQVEGSLTEAEIKYRSLVEEALVGVYLYQDGQFSYINPRYAEIFGYTQEEILNMDVMELVFPEDKPLVTENIRRRISGEVKTLRYFYRGVRKDGRIINLEVHGTATLYNGKPAIIGTLLDITDRIKTEELLRKSDKLAVVGELAAGVAHEIRNPLTSLRGFVQLLQKQDHEQQRYFEIMLSELDRINFIVSEFLLLAKPQVVNFEQKDLSIILQNVIGLLESEAILNHVQITLAYPSDIPVIECEENQIKQVCINILKNAIEATPYGGIVEIRVQRLGLDKVVIQFIDQGSGIPAERMEKLGEPFYTTKDKGTGLGLMVSYKIIESHHGELKIKSENNEGTIVDVILPVKR
ncbi:PAS domain S-box protein [Ammoniphilus sp. YIM 78166]|uniref:PAS domain S-box protein n=1 Tax=Ammoniphilus sp. YIM 78166 TaxID=1644106 RepID=UPI001070328F|nr:PAS domain S-box protein [Ammoniphilus sp. YIM 78166]